MTQDANQRARKEWLFTKYDAFGRVAFTGLHINSNVVARRTMQNTANTNTYSQYVTKEDAATAIAETAVYYTNTAIPHGISEVNTINYYDNYDFDIAGLRNPGTVYGEAITTKTKSLPTASKVRVLGTDKWITTVTYYDKKARPVYVASKNDYLATTDIIESKLDFVGKVLETKTTHTKGNAAAIVTVDSFEYDHMGRLIKQTQKINNQATEQIAVNNYDALGQLESKKVGGTVTASTSVTPSGVEGLQTVNYNYNVRGWLKGINDTNNLGADLFAFKINYDTTEHGAKPQYKYNVAEIEWQTANDNTQRWYAYNYDSFERILNATSSNGNYDLASVSYDKMGNIKQLQRTGAIVENIDPANPRHFGAMDDLIYTYDAGNKLLKVTDIANKAHGFKDGTNTNDDYDYNINGNLTIDQNKGITNVSYNHFNFPTQINVTTTEHNGNIQYVYDANGVKLKKTATDNGNVTTVEYNGNFVYENGSLKSIAQPEGYIEPENGSWKYVYEHKDIWGNTRVTYADDNNDGSVDKNEIRREQNYYPFGLTHKGYNEASYGVKNNLKTYQGQELTEDLGLNTHEWRYRMSDRSIGRFWQIDPLAETYDYNSTYAFQENKMGIGTELEGLEVNEFENITENEVFAQMSIEALAIAAEIGSFIDNLFASASGTASKKVQKSGDTTGSQSTTVKTTVKAEAGFNFESFFSNFSIADNGEIDFHEYPAKADVKTEVSTETSLKSSVKVTPVADITLETKEKTNLQTGDSSVSLRGTFGVQGNGIYISGSTSSDGTSKAEGGVKVKASTPTINGYSISGEVKIGAKASF